MIPCKRTVVKDIGMAAILTSVANKPYSKYTPAKRSRDIITRERYVSIGLRNKVCVSIFLLAKHTL